MVTPTNHVIAMAGFTLRRAQIYTDYVPWDFCNIFLRNKLLGKTKKKSYYLSAVALAGCYMVNAAVVNALRSEKDSVRTLGSNF